VEFLDIYNEARAGMIEQNGQHSWTDAADEGGALSFCRVRGVWLMGLRIPPHHRSC